MTEEQLDEFHADNMKYKSKKKIIVGYLVPINQTKYYKIFVKSDTKQVFHYEFFKTEIKEILKELSPNFKGEFKDSDYECIPRFRFLENDMNLYIPDNFHLNEMVTSAIIKEIGFIDKAPSIQIEKTRAEHFRELEGFTISRRVVIS